MRGVPDLIPTDRKNAVERADTKPPPARPAQPDAQERRAASLNTKRRRKVTLDLSGPPLRLPEKEALESAPTPFDGIERLPALRPSGLANAIELVDHARPLPAADLATEMAECFALGDFSGALRAAELLLGHRPEDESALRYARSSRDKLEQLYASRLGGFEQVPHVAVPESEIRWLGLDHRAGFLLSRIDGVVDIETLLDIAAMSRIEALKTLIELIDAGAVELRLG